MTTQILVSGAWTPLPLVFLFGRIIWPSGTLRISGLYCWLVSEEGRSRAIIVVLEKLYQ
jgi:hypothetical protein